VLQHRALLELPDGTPFSYLVETYTSEVLASPEVSAAAGASDEEIFAASSRMTGEISRSAVGRPLAALRTRLPLSR